MWWTITYDKLKELCGPEVAAVESAFEADDRVGWVEAANDDIDDCDPALAEAVHALRLAFAAKTGLTLEFCQYDSEMDQCCSDASDQEHEGIVFGVDGVEQFTSAGDLWKNSLVETKWIEAG